MQIIQFSTTITSSSHWLLLNLDALLQHLKRNIKVDIILLGWGLPLKRSKVVRIIGQINDYLRCRNRLWRSKLLFSRFSMIVHKADLLRQHRWSLSTAFDTNNLHLRTLGWSLSNSWCKLGHQILPTPSRK